MPERFHHHTQNTERVPPPQPEAGETLPSATEAPTIPVETLEQRREREYHENTAQLLDRAEQYIEGKRRERLPAEVPETLPTVESVPLPTLADARAELERSRSTSGLIAKLKERRKRAQLRRAGIENPDDLIAFTRYLEQQLINTESHHKYVKSGRANREVEKYRREGYTIHDIHDSYREGQVEFSIEREVPYRVSPKEEKKLAELLGKANDPVVMIERLKRLGFHIDGHMMKYQFEALHDFVESPEINRVLEKLEQAGIHVGSRYFGYNNHQYELILSEPYVADMIKDYAFDSVKQEEISDTNLEKIAQLQQLGFHISLGDHWDTTIKMVSDDDLFTLLTAIRLRQKHHNRSVSPREHWNDVLMLDDAELAGECARIVRTTPWLLDELLYEASYGRRHTTEERNQTTAEKIHTLLEVPIVQEMRNDPDLAHFLESVSILQGNTPHLQNIETYKMLREYPAAIPFLELCRELDIRPEIGGLLDILKNEKSQEILSEVFRPEFKEFVLQMKNTLGYQVELPDFLRYDFYTQNDEIRAPAGGQILGLFHNPYWREGMASGRAAEIIKKFGSFNIRQAPFYTEILEIPHSLEVLDQLEQKFQCNLTDNNVHGQLSYSMQYFKQVCEDEHMQKELFDEHTVQFYTRLQTAVKYILQFDDIPDLISASRDRTIIDNETSFFETAEKLCEYGFSSPGYMGTHFFTDAIPKILDVVQYDLLDVFEQTRDQPYLRNHLWKHTKELGAIPKEKRVDYIEICLQIDASPSQEIQRVKDSFMQQLLTVDNPVVVYKKIEDVFIKNNLPAVGKIYKVFDILHSATDIETSLKRGFPGSPTLTAAGARRRSSIIYNDLLRIHTDSANRSLRQYIETLQSGEKLLQRVDSDGIETLSAEEQKKFAYTLEKFHTLFFNSTLGKNTELVRDEMTLAEHYQYLRESLGVAEGASLNARIAEMFLRPLGIESLDGVLVQMRETKTAAHERNLELYRSHSEGLILHAGDLLKGTPLQYLPGILQNGSVAKEFLGSSAQSDSTPLDTDVSRVNNEDMGSGFLGAMQSSMATGFGNLIFVVRDRGQFQHTELGGDTSYDRDHMELFPTGGGKHYGIRTGFPSTEIDFMVARESLMQEPKSLEKAYYEIAQNGWYIPVCDTNGTVIFTPQMYNEYRKTFNGLNRFDGDALTVNQIPEDNPLKAQMQRVWETKAQDHEKLSEVSTHIRTTVMNALGELNIELKEEYDASIIGAQLLDIGSTGRNTNTAGSYDFDLILQLDQHDFSRAQEIATQVKEKFIFTEDKSHSEASGYYQLRAMGVSQIGGLALENAIDIDIGFAKKSDPAEFGSHSAVSEKLDWVRKNCGEELYQQTVATIVLTKELLNAGNAYKRVEHGGFGGIGVENWILYHNGNMREAFQSFWDMAYENGTQTPLEQFKKKYKILDPGMNLKNPYHGNFIESLKPEGYTRMLAVIETFLQNQ